MEIKAAIFDMDGTLIDSLKIWSVLWAKIGEEYLGDKNFLPSPEDDKTVRTLTLKDAMALIHTNYKLGENEEALFMRATRLLMDFYTEEVELKDGVREFLEYCRKSGVKMCIASATAPELVELALAHCGIEEYFSKIFSCGTIGKGKSEPDVFLLAADFLGESITKTWVFEDSLVAIETAVKIGMPTVGIYDRFNFGQEKIREIATEYIDSGETLMNLIDININYLQKLKYHYRPSKGWVNDPNGLVCFKGYYHVFYQHAPDYEIPWKQPMHWGHARTKDFLVWEELPVALYPDRGYDSNGCWSGTAIVKDDILYLVYASVRGQEKIQTVSVAYSKDGINFEKYEGNPVIERYPAEGGPDFRDPAVCFIDGTYYCVMATGNRTYKAARLLLYKSDDLFSWDYLGVMSEWADCKYAECPSFVPADDLYLLAASVCPLDRRHYFSLMYGNFESGKFTAKYIAEVDKGPDQYAGQVFRDHIGRNILISWVPGWKYKGFAEKDVGCMSVPRELKLKDGKITAYPIEELQHLLKDDDPSVKRTDSGFIIERNGREPVIYNGSITDLKILRDGYLVEVFVNGGEEVYTALL